MVLFAWHRGGSKEDSAQSSLKINPWGLSWRLGGCWPLQNEAEHLFPGHWLPETH